MWELDSPRFQRGCTRSQSPIRKCMWFDRRIVSIMMSQHPHSTLPRFRVAQTWALWHYMGCRWWSLVPFQYISG
jgi:hypothetical protein